MDVIGAVQMPDGSMVSLGTDMQWHSERPDLAALADLAINPVQFMGSTDGLPPGYTIVAMAARRLGGRAVLPQLQPLPPGVVS